MSGQGVASSSRIAAAKPLREFTSAFGGTADMAALEAGSIHPERTLPQWAYRAQLSFDLKQ